jgi:hypothetical protein
LVYGLDHGVEVRGVGVQRESNAIRGKLLCFFSQKRIEIQRAVECGHEEGRRSVFESLRFKYLKMNSYLAVSPNAKPKKISIMEMRSQPECKTFLVQLLTKKDGAEKVSLLPTEQVLARPHFKFKNYYSKM